MKKGKCKILNNMKIIHITWNYCFGANKNKKLCRGLNFGRKKAQVLVIHQITDWKFSVIACMNFPLYYYSDFIFELKNEIF